MPRGESEDREMGIARAGMFMMFPRRQLFSFCIRRLKRMAFDRDQGSEAILCRKRIGTLAHLISQPFFATPKEAAITR
jgi:hypothetical protein